MGLFWIVLAPLLAAFGAAGLTRSVGGKRAGLLLAIVPFAIAGGLLKHASKGMDEALVWSRPWLPSLGMDFSLMAGGYEILFLLLVSFIGGLILIYGGSYLEKDAGVGRFFTIVLLFMASMLGVILADDLMLLFVFWELTSITSFLLVGYKHKDPGARKAALQALLVTGGGGLALLAGLLLVNQITGATRISELVAHAEVLAASPLFTPAFLLILAGVFTKSAQVPFHFWLPGAMAAPTPVSAYLHSATMVKAGVILLAKLSPSMSQTQLWEWVVAPVGALTMVTGAVLAIVNTDLKKLLAYATVSVLGALVMLIGFGDPFSLKTALFLALVHGFYKGALFMSAGAIDHATGTRDVTRLSGLGRAMPGLAVAAGLAAVSMCGLPPTIGFISKELMYETQLGLPQGRVVWIAAAVLANALSIGVAVIVGLRPYFGKPGPVGVHHAPEWGLVVPPLILGLLGLVLGCAPGLLDKFIVSPAVAALGADPSVVKFSLWHGLTPMLALSGLTVALGALAFLMRAKLAAIPAGLSKLRVLTPTAWYDGILNGTLRIAAFLTGWIQNGQLRIYVRVTLATASGLILYSMALSTGKFELTSTVPVGFFETMIVVLMSASGIAAVLAKSRLSAILCLGGVGYSVALLFVAYGAPDLAITQLLVETLTVVLFSFVILQLPQIRIMTRRKERGTDGLVAVLAGLAMTAVVWKTVHVQMHEPISPGLVERSVTEAHGRNVVNVILVDFRALDTLGEILVLTLAGLGVTALLARRKRGAARAAQGIEADALIPIRQPTKSETP